MNEKIDPQGTMRVFTRPLVIEDLRQSDEETREDRADRYL